MSPGVQICLSGVLSFGVPLVLAVRELIVLRRRGGGFPGREGPPGPRITPPLSWRPSLPPLLPSPSDEPILGPIGLGPIGGDFAGPRRVRVPELV